MGRIITLSIATLVLIGQTGVGLSKAVGPSGERVANPAAFAVADGFGGRRPFAPRRYGVPPQCQPSPDAPARRQLDPGLRYLGPCDRPAQG
jgi:hypothetical protein